MRNLSTFAPDYGDLTTPDPNILDEAARLTSEHLPKLTVTFSRVAARKVATNS